MIIYLKILSVSLILVCFSDRSPHVTYGKDDEKAHKHIHHDDMYGGNAKV